ncbi:MAG TPA: hypothetical protein V6D29_16430 [Leptolyngbyaceae cyanobacterium]
MTTRKPHQNKPIKEGHKSQRGIPELYSEKKKSTSYGLTPHSKGCIDQQAEAHGVSASQYIELIGRGELKVIPLEQFALVQELLSEIAEIINDDSQSQSTNKAFIAAPQLLLKSTFIFQSPIFILIALLFNKSKSL